jgi:hypothetical protein
MQHRSQTYVATSELWSSRRQGRTHTLPPRPRPMPLTLKRRRQRKDVRETMTFGVKGGGEVPFPAFPTVPFSSNITVDNSYTPQAWRVEVTP